MRDRGNMLELAILGRLADGPLHGYELRKRLATTLGPFRALSFGSLYPRLRILESKGWVSAAPTADLPHALAGKRSRIVYHLTPEGKERLAQTLAHAEPAAWDDDTFDVRFSLFGETDPDTRLRILEGRRARVLERREATRAGLARQRDRRDAYTQELQRHGLEMLDREVGWLEDLIAHERFPDSAPQAPSDPPAPPSVSGLGPNLEKGTP